MKTKHQKEGMTEGQPYGCGYCGSEYYDYEEGKTITCCGCGSIITFKKGVAYIDKTGPARMK